MNNTSTNRKAISLAAHAVALAGIAMLVAGCGSVTVRHVPKVITIAPTGMSDLRSSQPLDVKAGECSPAEVKIGTAGIGKVVGKYTEWTESAVGMVRTNLIARGATLVPGAAKALIITMSKANLHSVWIPGGASCNVTLSVTTPEGLNPTFEASNYSMAPLGAIDGAVEDAVKKLLADPAVDGYLRK
jgi:hypothetical protein